MTDPTRTHEHKTFQRDIVFHTFLKRESHPTPVNVKCFKNIRKRDDTIVPLAQGDTDSVTFRSVLLDRRHCH